MAFLYKHMCIIQVTLRIYLTVTNTKVSPAIHPRNHGHPLATMNEPLKEVIPMFGDVPFTLEFDLPDEYKKKALVELGESPETVAQSLEEFRELLKGEPGLRFPLDEDICTLYLRRSRWDPKKAFVLVQRLFRFKQKHSKIFNNFEIQPYYESFTYGIIRMLPLRDRNGCRIILLIMNKNVWDPKKISLDDIYKHMQVALSSFISEPRTQVAGIHFIFDCEGLSLKQAMYVTINFASLVVESLEKCAPFRVKGIHIVHQPYFMNMIYAIFKQFFQGILQARVFFHGRNRESLNSYFEPEILPISLGGHIDMSDPNLIDSVAAYLCSQRDNIINILQYGYVNEDE